MPYADRTGAAGFVGVLVVVQAWDHADPSVGFAVATIKALAAQVDEISVVALRVSPFTASPASNVRIYSLGKERYAGFFRMPYYLWQWHRTVLGILRERRITVAFVHMAPPYCLMLAPYLAPRRIPIVMWYTHPLMTWVTRFAHRVSAAVVSVSRESYPYRADKLVALGHGIDTDLFSPGAPASGVPRILHVGRVAPIKRLEAVVAGLGTLAASGVAFEAVFLGPGIHEEYAESLRVLARESGIAERISFVSGVPHAELPAEYLRAAACVNMTPFGSFDKAVLESFACGVPVVFANPLFIPLAGSHADMLHAPDIAPPTIARMLGALLALPSSRRALLAGDLREAVVRDHRLSSFVSRLTDVFRSVSL